MQDDYFTLMCNITRAAYPQPGASVDPVHEGNLRTIAEYRPEEQRETLVDVPDFLYEEERDGA